MKRIIFFVILGMALYSLISIAIIEARAESVEVEPGLYIDVPGTMEAEDLPETTEAEDLQETTEAEDLPETTEAEDLPETTEAEDLPETMEAEDLPETTEERPDDRLDYLKDLHDDNRKIMISIWCLSGLFLGSKLISRMFGNG